MTGRNLVLLLLLPLVACGQKGGDAFQGYVEGEFLHVALPNGGRLDRMSVERGQRVATGDALFALESGREQAALAGAEKELAAAGARLADLAKGRRPEELAVLRAQLAQAQSQRELARAQYRRQRELRGKGLISAEQLDQARTEDERAQARVNEVEAALAAAGLGGRTDALQAARDQVAVARAAVDQARWQLDHRAAAAPQGALVDDVYYQPGEWVGPGAPVVSLLPPGQVKLRFFVPETVVGALRAGQTVAANCDACGEAFTATITHVAAQAEFTPPVIYSREQRQRLVFRVEARPDPERAAALHPGQPVDVRWTP